jgi:hypothetical protein
MKNILTIMMISVLLISCKKYQKGCLVNRTAAFQVNNESPDTCKFVLIQNSDTIRETIMPHAKYEYIVKAGPITKAYVYRADTLYVESRPDFKMKRCEMDGDLIR